MFVHCSFTSQIWGWIAQHNNFEFQGTTIDDLWFIDASIPLKDRLMVELVRGAVLWTIWLERNKLCFDTKAIPPLRVLGAKIIALATFWCKTLSHNTFLIISMWAPPSLNAIVCTMRSRLWHPLTKHCMFI